MGDTAIAWTDKTWNPVTGCSKVSAGCKHCYAERIFNRNLPGMKGQKFTDVTCHDDRLELPLHWRKPCRVFVNSMSDLFHRDVPEDFINAVYLVMARASQHTFQVLTKRPARWLDYSQGRVRLPNVWEGVSCENQQTADERIPLLLQTPAALRWASVEPMLGAIDLRYLHHDGTVEVDALSGTHGVLRPHQGRNNRLDWVVIGAESGPGARPCRIEWVRNLKDQCAAAGVPLFVKQLHYKGKLVKDIDQFPPDLQIREYPRVQAANQA